MHCVTARAPRKSFRLSVKIGLVQRTHQLGRYHLLDRLAFGGMAEIYRAKTFDPEGRARVVAIKRILAHLAEDEDFIQMLVDEAKIASLLKHPNISQVYEFARAQGEYFIAMEHVDGKDARTILERCRALGRPMPPELAAYITAEVASALHAAHAQVDSAGEPLRIVHRDVSPSNVLCAYSGEVKLCDFGIAKATLSQVQTKTGVIKGKVKYMSPEQAMGRRLDHRSDVFSLGAVLYEMLTNIPPFTASHEMELLLKVRDAHYRPVQELEPDVPTEIAEAAHRALTRSRAARFQTAHELSVVLRGALATHYPHMNRGECSRWLRQMFEHDIERELRRMEQYVLTESHPGDVGENLIADALGPDAEYSRFTSAAPPGTGSSIDASTDASVDTLDEDEPIGDPRQPTPPPVPAGAARKPSFHDARTQIIDRNSGRPETRTRTQKKPARKQARGAHPGSPGGRDPSELDPAIHDAPTLILNRNRRGKDKP